ncbi:peptidylprolyl isomerase [Actinophytocola sediminis]
MDGAAVEVAVVDRREAALRAGPRASTLPRPGTSEGRQLRRWLVQVLVAERVVAREAARRGLDARDAPELAELVPDRAGMLGLGSVAADLLTRDAVARAVYVAVTAGVSVSDAQVARYWTANPEAFRVPERRLLRHAVGDVDPATRPVRAVRRGELTTVLEDAVFGASPGTAVGPVLDAVGAHTVLVVDVAPARVRALAEVREEIRARLALGARRRAFVEWLDRQLADSVRLAAGFEHPGDPAQPDNTHRH